MKQKGCAKTGGRQVGTLNKRTAELRNYISDLVVENIETIKEDIKTLKPEQRLLVLEKLLKYVLPVPQSAEFPVEYGLQKTVCGNQSWVDVKGDEVNHKSWFDDDI